MKRVGAHVSIAGGVENAPVNAYKIHAKAFALFTKNQRRWLSKPLSNQEITKFQQNCQKLNYSPDYILPHSGYLINLGNPEKNNLIKSREFFIDEINRCRQLGLKYLNFHPGSHKNMMSESDCLNLIAASINFALERTKDIILVIENTAGQGSSLGYRFEHIAFIIEKITDKKRIAVCLDTCHVFSAGYDIRTPETYQTTMQNFNEIIGLKYLKGIHLNDSKAKFGSRVDRHQSLGKGEIGWKIFKIIMNDSTLEEIPLILETIDETLWPEEINRLYSFHT